jgi:hypothetical protein
MTLLNTANRIYKGVNQASNVYAGTTLVWPTLSPLYAVFDAGTSSNVLITGGGLNIKNTTSGMASQGARVADAAAKTTGKFYYEVRLTAWVTGGSVGIGGVGTTDSLFTNMQNNGTNGVMLSSAGGQVWTVGTVPVAIGGRVSGDLLGFAIDLDNHRFWVRDVGRSASWNGNSGYNPATNVGGITIPSGNIVPFCTFGGVSTGPGNIVKTNFGHYSFTGAVPSGFTSGWTV